jgi:hypothetical protein
MPDVRVAQVIVEYTLPLPAFIGAGLAILAGGASLTGLVLRRPAIEHTTLVPAWWWAVLATVAWCGVELAAVIYGSLAPDWLEPLRLAAVTLSFCPILAVLGAKRPQHMAWSFVVAAFWGIVALPAAETFFLQGGQRLEMGDARGWFLWVLIALAPINYLLTRQWLAVALLAAGQSLALSEYLPLISRTLFAEQHLAAVVLAAAAVGCFRRPQARETGNGYDRLWRDFRNTFGLFWALRLQERVNSVSDSSAWPFWLSWSGLRDKTNGLPPTQIDPSIEPTLRTTFRGLLRRFVSGRWIAERLGRDID